MGWFHHLTAEGGTVHVWPEYEAGHATEGGTACFCSPDTEFCDNGAVLVIHRDMLDRMELE